MILRCPFCMKEGVSAKKNHYVFYVHKGKSGGKSTRFIEHIRKHTNYSNEIKRQIIHEAFYEAWTVCDIPLDRRRGTLQKIEAIFPRKIEEINSVNNNKHSSVQQQDNQKEEDVFELIYNIVSDINPQSNETSVYYDSIELEPLFKINFNDFL